MNKLILSRQKLLSNLNSEEILIKNEIRISERELTELEIDLEKQKKLYIKSLRYVYKNSNSYQQVGFVFAAKSFNQAMSRMMYLKKFGEYQKGLLVKIKKEKGEVYFLKLICSTTQRNLSIMLI